MMRTLLFTLLSLASSLVLAATVYKWVDENGTVHYSDQPHPNAQKIQVQAAQTYPASASATAVASAAAALEHPASAPAYRGCAIVSPQDGASFANVDEMSVSVRTDPSLHSGDQVFILMDGTAVNGGNATGTQFSISPVERGEHVLEAVVRDSSGNLMCQTPGVTVAVHQNSVLNRANPQNVRPRPH
ncbi:MAG TPA: DUF4124 domain-containing protein [Steroidobacteraceae bacterium]|jgi:hypothetical protein